MGETKMKMGDTMATVAQSRTFTTPVLRFQVRAGSIEWPLFVSVMVVLLLHVADATTWHAQANANAIERLLQFLVAVALPIGAIGLYASSGKATRGAIAFTFGCSALFAGVVVHLIGVIKNGFGSGDATGLALIPVGLALIVLGLVRLFGAIPKKRYRLIAIPFALIAIVWGVVPVGLGVYMTHAPRYEITAQDLGRPYEDATFETSDGITISGWYVPSQNGAAILVAHGAGGARIRPLLHVRLLVDAGYGVLVFDARGHGESEGGTNTYAWGADADVVAAAHYLDTRPDVEDGRIGALGLSMGAEMVLDGASQDTPISAVVADGAGVRSVKEMLDLRVTWKSALATSWVASINVSTMALSGGGLPPAIGDRVSSIQAPTLYIASTHEPEERELNRTWFGRTNAPKELWAVDAPHTGGLRTFPDEYAERVLSFFEQNLLEAP
jgi:pimeloyl-ACP methyl ester carboxylesterase